jgi:hypothetical protein
MSVRTQECGAETGFGYCPLRRCVESEHYEHGGRSEFSFLAATGLE